MLVGRVMSQNLDRAKPLWEMWVVEGLDEGKWALVSKVHHCMVDGVAATDLMSVLLDAERDPPLPAPDAWTPEPGPGGARLLAEAIVERAANPFAAGGGLGGGGAQTPGGGAPKSCGGGGGGGRGGATPASVQKPVRGHLARANSHGGPCT